MSKVDCETASVVFVGVWEVQGSGKPEEVLGGVGVLNFTSSVERTDSGL